MAEIDDLKMILRNADVSCITDAKTNAEQKIRFGECIIFVSGLERREAEIRAKAISEFAERCNQKITDFILEHQDQLDFVSGVGMGWRFVEEVAEAMKGE